MNKTAVIFNSKTGFTEKYALWIAEETKATPISFKECTKKRVNEILSEYDTVIFGSRLHAGIIENLSKAKKLFGTGKNRFIIFTTGAAPADTPETKDTLKKVWEQNLTAEEREQIPHFYMQGGLCYEKMPFIDKIMMKGFVSMLKKKKDKDGLEAGMAKAVESSFDISDKKYIMPLVDYLKKSN
ncbi:MAG: hypothetical protein HDT46_09210 [Ruminococcaceae bacterium]|nr:hypothetical protein [Oscillospiraceae bacterium]